MSSPKPWSVRPMRPGDEPLVVSSHMGTVTALARLDPVQSMDRVVVACSPEDPDVIVGWALLAGDGSAQFVYVKKHFRGAGVAASLIGDKT